MSPKAPNTPNPAIEAAAIEQRKNEARNRVRTIFGEGDPAAQATRQQFYDTTGDASRSLNKGFLDEEGKLARAALRARMFEQGLQGGSVDVEKNALVDRSYQQGLLDIESEAEALERNLKSSDEAAKLETLSQIDAGQSGETAAAEANARLQANANDALARSKGRTVGNIFANLSSIYPTIDYNRGRTQAQGQFGPSMNYQRPSSSLGRIFNY